MPARPMQKRRLLRLRVRSSSPSSRTALSAVLSAMRMPAALRNVSATRRHPYLNRDFSHIPAMAGRSVACLPEGGLASWQQWAERGIPMGSRSAGRGGYSRLGGFAVSCFRLPPRGPPPRRPFVLRSPPPSRGGRTADRAPPRPRAPSSFVPADGRRGRRRLPLGAASPGLVSARRCARRARGRGPCSRPRRGDRLRRREA